MQNFFLILAFILASAFAYSKDKEYVSKKFHCYHYDQQKQSHQGIHLARDKARMLSADKCKSENQGEEKLCEFKYCVEQTSISSTSN